MTLGQPARGLDLGKLGHGMLLGEWDPRMVAGSRDRVKTRRRTEARSGIGAWGIRRREGGTSRKSAELSIDPRRRAVPFPPGNG
jgi:hypothetical protein